MAAVIVGYLLNAGSFVTSATFLRDGHGSGFPDATVGSGYHEGASGHGHVQVLLHKALGGGQEGIPERVAVPFTGTHILSWLFAHLPQTFISGVCVCVCSGQAALL